MRSRNAARYSLRMMNTNGVQTEWNWSLIVSHDDKSSNLRMTKKRELQQVVIANAIIEKGKMVRLRILAERHSIR